MHAGGGCSRFWVCTLLTYRVCVPYRRTSVDSGIAWVCTDKSSPAEQCCVPRWRIWNPQSTAYYNVAMTLVPEVCSFTGRQISAPGTPVYPCLADAYFISAQISWKLLDSQRHSGPDIAMIHSREVGSGTVDEIVVVYNHLCRWNRAPTQTSTWRPRAPGLARAY